MADLVVAHLEATYDVGFDADADGTGWRSGAWRVELPVDLTVECPPFSP